MRGDADHAEVLRRELVADHGVDLSVLDASALTWAIEQGILRAHPLAGMRWPPQPLPRLPLALGDVDLLLSTATELVAAAKADADGARGRRRIFEA